MSVFQPWWDHYDRCAACQGSSGEVPCPEGQVLVDRINKAYPGLAA